MKHHTKTKTFWVYIENANESGVVVDAKTPQSALRKALREGLGPQVRGVAWAVELGKFHCLGRISGG